MARQTLEQRPRAARGVARARRGAGTRGLPWRWLALLVAVAVTGVAVLLMLWPGRLDGRGHAIAVLTTSDFHALAFSPTDPNVVFFGHHNGVMRSDDGGRTWRPLVQRPNFDAMGLAVSRSDPRQIYLAGHDVFQVSRDGGASWQPLSHNLPGTDIHGFAMRPDNPSHLYAFVVGHGLFTSVDGGRSWSKLSDRLPGDVMALAVAGGTPEILYAGGMRSGVLRSTDGGRSWEPLPGSPRGVMALVVDPAAPQTVYAGADGGLYKSTDGGGTWRKLPFPGANAVALAVSPGNPQVILAVEFVRSGEGRVYRSEDGGVTWGRRA